MGRKPNFLLMTFSKSVQRQGNLVVEKNHRKVIRGAAMYQCVLKGKKTNEATFAATRAKCAVTNMTNANHRRSRMSFSSN